MNINIKAKNLDLTPPLSYYINEKIGSLARFLKKWEEETGNVLADVEVSRLTKHHHKGDVFYAEVNLSLGGRVIRAQEKNRDIRVAVNKVRNKLQREVKKIKTKND